MEGRASSPKRETPVIAGSTSMCTLQALAEFMHSAAVRRCSSTRLHPPCRTQPIQPHRASHTPVTAHGDAPDNSSRRPTS